MARKDSSLDQNDEVYFESKEIDLLECVDMFTICILFNLVPTTSQLSSGLNENTLTSLQIFSAFKSLAGEYTEKTPSAKQARYLPFGDQTGLLKDPYNLRSFCLLLLRLSASK